MTALQFSSTSRMTWLWAPDAETSDRVRAVTRGRPASCRGEELPLVTDIDIGVDALTACEDLAAAGFTFTWHDSVHSLNRGGWPANLPGMPTTTTTEPEPRS